MKIILSVLVLFSIAFFVPSDVFGAWYDTDWEHRKKITLSLNTEISSDLNNFPVLVSVIDSDFTKSSNSEGRDIFFTADDGTTLLSYEIERFNSSTGEIIAWVNIPTLLAASTTDIYIYYKGPTQSTPSNMWDSNYKLVYHLNQTSTGTLNEFVDASGTGNDGTGGGEGDKANDTDRIPTRAEGKIGYGQSFDGPTEDNSPREGTGDFIWINSVIGWTNNMDVTAEFWINVDSDHTDVNMMDIFGYRAGGQNNNLGLFKVDSLNLHVNNGNLHDSTVDAATSDWAHVVAVYDSGAPKIYLDGVCVSCTGTETRTGVRANGNFVLGGEIDSATRVNNELVGDMDEFRISNTVRSADWVAASYSTQNNPSAYLSFGTEEPEEPEELEVKKSDDCYDCEAPKLTKVEVHITSQNSDTQRISTSSEIWNFDQKSPYPIFDDDITPIVADPGDEVQIILELTDNRTLERIADSGTYTNFLTKPNDMNTFYANNFDEYGKVSTTFYEWHNTGDDLFYDYDNTVQWSPAEILIEESAEYVEGGQAPNLDGLVGTFTISFKMKFLQPMQTTDVWVQGTDRSGNFFKVALPLTLKIAGNEPLVFESKVDQKVLGFYDDSMLNDVVSDWTGSTQDVSELAEILGIPDEHLPPWVANLALWVSEDRISMGDMIVSIEHLINN